MSRSVARVAAVPSTSQTLRAGLAALGAAAAIALLAMVPGASRAASTPPAATSVPQKLSLGGFQRGQKVTACPAGAETQRSEDVMTCSFPANARMVGGKPVTNYLGFRAEHGVITVVFARGADDEATIAWLTKQFGPPVEPGAWSSHGDVLSIGYGIALLKPLNDPRADAAAQVLLEAAQHCHADVLDDKIPFDRSPECKKAVQLRETYAEVDDDAYEGTKLQAEHTTTAQLAIGLMLATVEYSNERLGTKLAQPF